MDKLKNFIENLKEVDLFDINWSNFLTKDSLLDTNPSNVFIYEQWGYVLFFLSFAFGLFAFVFISKKFFGKKPLYRLIRKVSFAWISNSIFLLFYILMRTNGIRLFSARVVLLIILCIFPLLIVYSIIYFTLFLPRRMRKFEEARERTKYQR